MKYAFVQSHAERPHQGQTHSPRAYCKAFGLSRSGWQAYQRRQPAPEQAPVQPLASGDADLTSKASRKQALDDAARQIHAKARSCYGAIRMQAALQRRGRTLSLSSTKRLTRRFGLAQRQKLRRVCTTDSKHGLPIAANLLAQRFDLIHTPNRVWLCDITYIDTGEGWVYLAGVKNACSKKLVGWASAQHMRTELVMDALAMAIRQERPKPGLICHSDRGSQYASAAYRKMLDANQMQASMSRAGNCYDNAPMESF